MKFSYKARTKTGEVKHGSIDASSRKTALDILEKYELYVTSLIQEEKSIFSNIKIPFLAHISNKDVMLFTRQLAVMLKSAIPPVKALNTLATSTKNPNFRDKILRMAEGVETGGSLSQVFAMHPGVFNSFFVGIVRSGETTGKVADCLEYLANHLEKDYDLQQTIKGAMIYPAFVLTVAIGAFFVLTFFIIPKLVEMLKSFSTTLPYSTKILITLSEFVRKGGWVGFLAPLAAVIFSLQYLKRSKYTKDFYDKMILKVPFLGSFLKKVYLVRFTENLSILISSGLPITQALSITKDIMVNSIFREIIEKAEERVAKGETISSVCQEYPTYIPLFVTQMIFTGEETGRLEEILMDVVNFYGKEIERMAVNLASVFEPILIFFLGIGIALLAVAIFVPLFKVGLGGMTM